MPLNFPSSPTNGQQYTDDNAVVWQYDGVKWDVVTGTANKTYSGVRVGFTTDYSLTSTSAAVSFDSELFDTDTYFTLSADTKVTFKRSAFYRINFSVYTGTGGSTYTIALKKNGSTTLASVTLAPSQYTNYDEILELDSNDYIEVHASDSANTGTLTTATFLEVTRVGLSMGTAVASADAFSGARTKLTSTYNVTSTATAISWNTTEFDQNANPAGDTYWSSGSATRLTVKITGFYRAKCTVAVGSSGTYTAAVKKNGSTTLTSINISANGLALVDEIYELTANDYLELFINDLDSTGTLTTSTYLEITRIGV